MPNGWPRNRWLAYLGIKNALCQESEPADGDQNPRLDRIGFTWAILQGQDTWEQRFKELEAFKKRHGHCNVPRNYPPNRPLAYWVDKIRSLKRKGELDRKTIRRLNEMGFSWSCSTAVSIAGTWTNLWPWSQLSRNGMGTAIFSPPVDVWTQTYDWMEDVRKARSKGDSTPTYPATR